MRELIKEIVVISITGVLIIVGLIIGIYFILTKVNIGMGPYKCVDIDNNTIECEQTWRSDGILYGITKDGTTINLKSYKSIKED